MDFLLKGFDQSESVRRFRFETTGKEHARTVVVVSADLEAAREFDIPIQNLPLLCLHHLEISAPSVIAAGRLTITRSDMAAARNEIRELANQRKTSRPRRPVPNSGGSAWRGPAFKI